MTSNAEHLRTWLIGCGAVDGAAGFGVDFLGDAPGGWALMSAPSEVKYREDILGRVALREVQSQDYWLASREYGDGGPDALERYEAAARRIVERSAAGDLPEWEGGEVTAVAPILTPAPDERSAGEARYRMKIRVTYRID